MIYDKEIAEKLQNQNFAFVDLQTKDHVLYVKLNRAHKKNALNPTIVNELAYALSHAHYNNDIWLVELQAEGDVFCAGADLKAFMGIVEEHNSTIPDPPQEILMGELFKKLHKPCIAKVSGHVFAGGFLLLAGCTYVVAAPDIRLGLPEVKRGIFPYQVMACLMEIMPARKVIDWCIRGYDLPVADALELGLVTHIFERNEMDSKLNELKKELMANSPTAIRMGLQAYDHLGEKKNTEDHQYLKGMLMQTLQTKDAQEGIQAFREKRTPVWTGE